MHIKAKLEWFSDQKRDGMKDHSFRADHICLLALTCYFITDVPDNSKNLLVYNQERICNSRWLTRASGYLKTHLFKTGNLSEADRIKLGEDCVVRYRCVCPSFIMIHLNLLN